MTTLRSFLIPLQVRWHARKICYWCWEPATIRCKVHGVRLCGGPNCTHVHRHFSGQAARRDQGSLLKTPACVFVGLNDWLDYALNTVVALCAGTFLWWLILAL